MNPDEWLSISQAAARYGIPKRTLYTAIARGKIDSRQIAGHYVFAPQDVERWLAEGRHAPGRPKRVP